MGYVPPPKPLDFGRATATLYTLAQIADVGTQLLRQSGIAATRSFWRQEGYERYRFDLYGARTVDRFSLVGWGFVITALTGIVTIVGRIAGWW